MRTECTFPAPPGKGGLGRHLEDVLDDWTQQGLDWRCCCTGPVAGQRFVEVPSGRLGRVTAWPPMRWWPGFRAWIGGEMFDRRAARQFQRGADELWALQGAASHTFAAARRIGIPRLGLFAATAHIEHVQQQHAAAHRRHPIERDWLSPLNVKKVLREYEQADVIEVTSDYMWQTMLDHGVPEAKLRKRRLTVPDRFQPPDSRADDGVFRIVYVGSVTVTKGIPILLEAFDRLDVPRKELTLVGGWATRPMRKYLQKWQEKYPDTLHIAPGDPLPHLHRASVYVHPSWQDGWGYAPHEALATGLPVVVTHGTGMKELILEGENGRLVGTGDVGDLTGSLMDSTKVMNRSHANNTGK